jgi:uncharacterized protein YjbI with pentapeptide repeats
LEACDLSNAYARNVSTFNFDFWKLPDRERKWFPTGITPVTFPPEELNETVWRPINVSNVHVYVAGPDFSYANLAQAKLIGATLSKSRFLFASLSAASYSGGQFPESNFYGATMFGSDLSGSKLNSSVMSKAKMNGTLMNFADLTNVNFTGANLQGADLWGATISGTVFTDAELTRTKMPN